MQSDTKTSTAKEMRIRLKEPDFLIGTLRFLDFDGRFVDIELSKIMFTDLNRVLLFECFQDFLRLAI